LVLLNDTGGKRESTARRGAELLRRRERAIHVATGGGGVRTNVDRGGDLEPIPPLAEVLEVLRQHGPIPLHMHQNSEQAAKVGCECKPESYYFLPQHSPVTNSFPHTFFGLTPGTTQDQVCTCLQNWNKGDNGIFDLSQAYRLKVGTGWLVPPACCTGHARCARMSSNGGAMCSECTSRWSRDEPYPIRCW